MQNLCDTVCDLLMEESNIQPVPCPVTVCGDIHGQFYDLEELFRTGGQVRRRDLLGLSETFFVSRKINPGDNISIVFHTLSS